MRLLVLITGLLGLSSAFAGEYRIDIKTDSRGDYYVVEKGGTANNPTLTVKWVGPGGTPYYVKRSFDCKAGTAKYLGEGESLEAATKLLPDEKMLPLGEGSIPRQLADHVCPKQ